MKVHEFAKCSIGGMFRLVDATKTGCITRPQIIIEADKNVVCDRYGEKEIEMFEAVRKGLFILYVK